MTYKDKKFFLKSFKKMPKKALKFFLNVVY